MRKRKGRSTALFLVFCMVLSMMSAIPARAAWDGENEDFYGLLAVDRLETYWDEQDEREKILLGDDEYPAEPQWGEDGQSPTPGERISYTDWKEASIAGSVLWLDYSTIDGVKTHILAKDIAEEVEYSEINPDEMGSKSWEKKQKEDLIEEYTAETNKGEKEFVLFRPDKPGYYRFSCAQCNEENETDKLIVHVDYPEIGFYSESNQEPANLYLDNYIYDNSVDDYIGLKGKSDNTIYVNLYNRYNADSIELTGECTLSFWDDEADSNIDLNGNFLDGDSESDDVSSYMSVEQVTDESGWYKITFNEALSSKDDFSLKINGIKKYKDENEDEHEEPMEAYLNGIFRQPGLYVTCDGEDLHSGEDDWLTYYGGINPEEAELRFGNFTKDENTGKIKEEDLNLNELNGKTFKIEAQRFEEGAEYHDVIVGEDCTYEITDDGALKIKSFYQQVYRITIGDGEPVCVHPCMDVIEFFNTPEYPDDPEKITNRICTAKVDEGKTEKVYVLAHMNPTDPFAANMDDAAITVTLEDEDKTEVKDYIEVSPITKELGRNDDDVPFGFSGYEIKITDQAKEDFRIKVVADAPVKPDWSDELPRYDKELLVEINKGSSLKVKTQPKKTVYTEGETFDPTGMTVELVYEDGTKETVQKGYTVTPAGPLTATNTSVMVEYCGLKTTQPITVKQKQQPTTEQPTTQQPTTQTPPAAQPSTEGTVLSSQETGEKAEFTVTSDNGANPTVAYKKTTDKKEKSVKVPNTVKVNGVTYKVTSIADNAFKGNKTITKVTVGSNITSIGKNAFASCTKLKSITIPKNVTTVGDNAFKGCTALTKVTLPAKTKKVGKNAFYGCKKISKVTFKGTSVTKIGDGAFRKCSALKSVSIPKNVTEIGKDAFRDCKKLKTITIKGTKLKKIGKNVFKNLPKNVTIKVPKKKKAAYKKLLKKAGYKGKVK